MTSCCCHSIWALLVLFLSVFASANHAISTTPTPQISVPIESWSIDQATTQDKRQLALPKQARGLVNDDGELLPVDGEGDAPADGAEPAYIPHVDKPSMSRPGDNKNNDVKGEKQSEGGSFDGDGPSLGIMLAIAIPVGATLIGVPSLVFWFIIRRRRLKAAAAAADPEAPSTESTPLSPALTRPNLALTFQRYDSQMSSGSTLACSRCDTTASKDSKSLALARQATW